VGRFGGGLGLGEQLARLLEEHLAGGGEPDGPAATVKQRHAELTF
jgi:hypothetical protein